MSKRVLATVGLCLALVLAGCAGPAADPSPNGTNGDEPGETPPADGTSPDTDTLTIQVSGNGTYTVTATVVTDENDGVRVYYTDGSSVTYNDLQMPDSLPDGALDDASMVEPILDGAGVSLTTQNGTGGSLSWPAEPSTLLYSVSDGNGHLLGWDYVDCREGHLLELTISISESGSVSTGRSCTN